MPRTMGMPSHNRELTRTSSLSIEYELSELSELDRATDEAAAVKIVLGHPLEPAMVKRRGLERTPLVIVGYDQRPIVKTLSEQRSSAATALRPIAVVGVDPSDALPIVKQLADAVVGPRAQSEPLEMLRDRLLKIMGAVDNLSPAHDDRAMLMLQHLYSRESDIRPIVDPTAQFAYRYPLAEHILSTSSSEALDVLQDLAEHELLTGRPIDRLFLCPGCGSYRVPVKELCPECQTPNVSLQDSIHHFRCGYVGPESEFISGGGRPSCPKCHAELRHIGVEYNRPGRIVTCQQCGHWASEPQLRAWCVECDSYHAPEQLSVVRISRFGLTGTGARVAQVGRWNPYQTHVMPAPGGPAEAPQPLPVTPDNGYVQARNVLRPLIDIASVNEWPMAVYRADVMLPMGEAPSVDASNKLIQKIEKQLKKSLGSKDVVAQVGPGTFLILATKNRGAGAPEPRDLEARVDKEADIRVQITGLTPGAATELLGILG